MRANQIGDVIAHFIGSFEIATETDRSRQSYDEFSTSRGKDPAFGNAGTHPAMAPPLPGQGLHDPQLDLSPDPFGIAHVRGRSLHSSDIEIAPPQFDRHHRIERADDDDMDLGAHAARRSSGAILHTRATIHRDAVRPDGEVSYHEHSGSILVAARQDTTLFDDDRLTLVDGFQPSMTPNEILDELDDLMAYAQAWSHAPEATSDIGTLKSMLGYMASGDAPREVDEVAPGGTRSEHAGLYVNGASAEGAPSLKAILEGRSDDDRPAPGMAEGPHAATVSLGGNLLANETVVIQASTYAGTSVVFGDYRETNVIRQLNIRADEDVLLTKSLGVFMTGGSRSFNVASFERVDPMSDRAAHAPVSIFPLSYKVDVVEGDLFVSNFVRQIHKVSDNDGALFTSIDHDASIVMGGNTVLNAASFSQLTLGYDLVVFGGSVFEGNFIEQINLLFDRDRIGADGVFAKGTTGETGGNLLYNTASIRTIGATGSFDEVDPAIRDLVNRFDAREGTIPAALSSDLSFLGSAHLKVLYITGDYVEINAISQLNILSDADTAGSVDRLIGEITSDEAVWTISTGNNLLVNSARIVDADAGGHRQLGGQFYSDSVLVQADLVSGGDGIEIFDTSKLANELVAFTADAGGDGHHDDDGHHHFASAFDGSSEGLGGILS